MLLTCGGVVFGAIAFDESVEPDVCDRCEAEIERGVEAALDGEVDVVCGEDEGTGGAEDGVCRGGCGRGGGYGCWYGLCFEAGAVYRGVLS